MSETLFSERVNAVAKMINQLTPDPGERVGIACTLVEIFRFDLQKNLVVFKGNGERADTASTETGQAVDEKA